MSDYMRQMLVKRDRGIHCGMTSFCTANELVIEACMEQALRFNDPVLIEATANQVNQFGGYTGMQPEHFKSFVYGIADQVGFPRELVILGGDHLGPLVWCKEPEAIAMKKAEELVKLFVLAGFQKIHLDTSMRLGDDDPEAPLSDETIARRGASLYQACMEAYEQLVEKYPSTQIPAFIIGSEVPIPGGAQEPEEGIEVTSPEAMEKTLTVYQTIFDQIGAKNAFDHVIGVVVQPGVEFGDTDVFPYDRSKASALCSYANTLKGIVMEGHSTDYQSAQHLREMVEDGIAILKVGPALTFALREGLFALSMIEKQLFPEDQQSKFIETLEAIMLEQPANWQGHYHGDETELATKRKFSFSDRCRYYMSHQDVQRSTEKLLKNMDSIDIPLSMLHQYMPLQYNKVRDGRIPHEARAWVKDCVTTVIDDYNYATKCAYAVAGV